jgi:hypothetical protein
LRVACQSSSGASQLGACFSLVPDEEVPEEEVPDEEVPDEELVPDFVVPPLVPPTPVIVDSPPLSRVEVPDVDVEAVGVRVVMSPERNCRCSRGSAGRVGLPGRRRRC